MKSQRCNIPIRAKISLSVLSGLLVASMALCAVIDGIEFQNTILSEHNRYRAQHLQTRGLVEDSTLAGAAQSRAEHLLETGALQHESGIPDGENLYWARQPLPQEPPFSEEQIAFFQKRYPNWQPPKPVTGASLAIDAAASWYGEYDNYSYATTRSINGNPVGHFTQMVWKETDTIGCGLASRLRSDNQVEAVVVCRYRAAGNSIVRLPGMTPDQARHEAYNRNVRPRK
ncbi:MAG: CAP family protein [Gammaproteobacteria bacterium]